MKTNKALNLFLVGLLMCSNMLLTLPARAMYSETVDNSQEFGTCAVDPVYETSFWGVVKTGVRVRNIACMDGSKILTTLTSGSKIKVIAKTDGWYKVKTQTGVMGWVGQTLISETGEADWSAKEIVTDNKIAQRLQGYIVLQVEANGEAWYVNYDQSRFYLKDGNTAYNMMRDLGLGISNKDLASLKANNQALKNRLKGKIVLQVEDKGQAYYISPKDGSISYLKDGQAAFQVMRQQGLGITNENLNQIAAKSLEQYKEEQTKPEVVVEGNSEVDNSNGEIKLAGSVINGQAKLNWQLNNMTSSMGFKVVVKESLNPVYPGDEYHYLSEASVRNDVWSDLEVGKTYYFRVCEYLGGKCGVYSNNLKLTVPGEISSENRSISLKAIKDGSNVKLTWALNNMTSKMGFKVVIAEHVNPVYPGDEYHYLSDANVRSDWWHELEAGKTYNFRVCEYLGGKCGVYSNNIVLSF